MHEAGHAVVAFVLGMSLKYVSIERQKVGGMISLGYTSAPIPIPNGDISPETTVGWIAQALAGVAAESMINPEASSEGGSDNDFQSARRIAAFCICNRTVGEHNQILIEPEEINRCRERIDEVMKEGLSLALTLVTKHERAIRRTCNNLMKKSRLTGKQVAKIVAECADPKATESTADQLDARSGSPILK